MNSYQATGRLTRDPELRELPSGDSVCEMRLAIDGMGRGGRNAVGYLDVSLYGKSGEAAAQGPLQGLARRLRRPPRVPRVGRRQRQAQRRARRRQRRVPDRAQGARNGDGADADSRRLPEPQSDDDIAF